MKGLSRKERERINRKESIIDAAIHVIHLRGFEGATMKEIAKKAELGKGTLYLHFKSKVSIYLAICNRGSLVLNDELSNVLSKDMKGLQMVEVMGQVYLNFVQKNPLYFDAFNYYEGILDKVKYKDNLMIKQCEENARQAMTYIVRALQIGMQDGSIRDTINPKELGLIIWGASKGVMHLAFMKNRQHHHTFLDDVEFSFQSLIKNFISLIGGGIKNDRQSK